MSGLISVNGVISEDKQATIPALDRGFLFGDNVFEVFVAFGSKILDGHAHLDRLHRSAAQYGIHIPWSHEALLFEMEALLVQTGFKKANLRLVVTRGNGLGLSISADMQPNRVIYCMPARQEPLSLYADGLRLKKKALMFTERGASAKTGNYIRSVHALQEAQSEGFDDVLWYNADNEITEASTANIFFLGRHGDLLEIATPPASSGLLLGITRQRVISLLTQSQIPVTERVVHVEELPRFDEAFVCSTVRGLVPVQTIDRQKLHSTRSRAIFRHIERLYQTWVASEIGYRVDWNTGQANDIPKKDDPSYQN